MMLRILAKFLAKPAVAKWLIKQAKKRPYIHIPADTAEYMERYWLIPESWNLPFAVRIHIIKAGDTERHLHDHPFSFRTFILSGSYIEERNLCGYVRKRGETYRLPHNVPHRIHDLMASPFAEGVVTLFVTGKRIQQWGFYTGKGKVNYEDYRDSEKVG